MTRLIFIIDKIALVLDKKIFCNNKKLQSVAAFYFYITSYVTSFFLFSTLGQALFTAFASYVFYNSIKYFQIIVMLSADFGVLATFRSCFYILPSSFFFLIYFYFFLLELCFNNTLLVSCNSVNQQINELYGNHFIKMQGYNTRGASVSKVLETGKLLGYGISAAIAGGTVSTMCDSFFHHKNYELYIEAKKANPQLEVSPPTKGITGLNIGFFKN